jgi:hypothetical protein
MILEGIAVSALVGLADGLLIKYGVWPIIDRKKLESDLLSLCRQAVETIRNCGKYKGCFDRKQALVEPCLFKSGKPVWDQFLAAFLEGDVHTDPDWGKLYQAYQDEFADSITLINPERFAQCMSAIWSEFQRVTRNDPLFLDYHCARVLRSLDAGITTDDARRLMLEYCRLRAVLCYNRSSPKI